MLTRAALGAQGIAPPSDRLLMGHIGVGGMGGGHLGAMVNRTDASVVAVCDVDQDRLASARHAARDQAEAFTDYRRLLDRKDIDAVVVASPDHWHPLMTIHACEAGKDVYCEKPLSVTVLEGQTMVQAARRYARVVQLGTQWRSSAIGRCTAQYVRNGYCGRVREVRCWHYPNPTTDFSGDSDPPKGLDWDMWLGPMPWVQYNPKRHPANFRWFLDNGGGNIRDRGAHIFSLVSWAMDADRTGPVSIEATGVAPQGLWDNPVTMSATWEFKDPDWTLHWDQPGEPHGGEYGAIFIGDKDTVCFHDSIAGEQKVMFEPKPGEIALERSDSHMDDFLACVRSRKRPVMDVEIGHRVTSLCNLGNVAYRLRRKLQWDAPKEQFIGDDAANRWLSYVYRKPWHL
jgi:predicted dehydrogenase